MSLVDSFLSGASDLIDNAFRGELSEGQEARIRNETADALRVAAGGNNSLYERANEQAQLELSGVFTEARTLASEANSWSPFTSTGFSRYIFIAAGLLFTYFVGQVLILWLGRR